SSPMAHPLIATTRPVDDDDWVVNSNDALRFHFFDPTNLSPASAKTILHNSPSFAPVFTYPLFGLKEKIYGYKDLTMDLYFSQAALSTFLQVRHSAQRPSISEPTMQSAEPPTKRTRMVSDVATDTPEEILRQYVTIDSADNVMDFLIQAKKADARFVPHGNQVFSYQLDSTKDPSVSYVVHRANFATPGFADYHRRLRCFVLFYIEGASYIEEDPRWDIYTIYRKTIDEDPDSATYALVGFTTTYRFYHYPDQERPRISQFLILPPYAGQGHGRTLYQMLYQQWLADPVVYDISVEDPSDLFSDLRDKCDLRYLLEQGVTDGLQAPLSSDFIKRFCRRWKLSQ
ncbi:histone acetyltransferase 1, partial [Dimargaris xerosporica]